MKTYLLKSFILSAITVFSFNSFANATHLFSASIVAGNQESASHKIYGIDSNILDSMLNRELEICEKRYLESIQRNEESKKRKLVQFLYREAKAGNHEIVKKLFDENLVTQQDSIKDPVSYSYGFSTLHGDYPIVYTLEQIREMYKKGIVTIQDKEQLNRLKETAAYLISQAPQDQAHYEEPPKTVTYNADDPRRRTSHTRQYGSLLIDRAADILPAEEQSWFESLLTDAQKAK